ncbi:histidinol-phosphate transaminase [Methylomarinum sp. Ch1-1]|uniref:Histidinol-phosphate aminotransferase n=1 Tax=Methylomarinum roseum TaxID=3067653 RepID=A0AAU7NS04_9GAMM|nr:histidinol-phosphate transaminase [Methylomarinum sp. Ch1-1]MDP4520275.1 histidinol-phosphate transaminase [Methylomarinum sp. Ch1-1]
MNHSITQLAVPGVQKLVPYVPGKPIEELERELGLSDIVKLASNENPLGANPRVAAAIQAALPELPRYPDGNGFKLKTALAEKLAVSTEQLTLGNGSNEILELIARTFLTPELEVVFSQHAFAVYPLVTQAVGAKARVVAAKDYGHDLTAMLAQVNDRTRLVFIANPNNPTGTLLSKEALEAFIKALPASVICVLDEAYYEYVDPQSRADALTWLAKYPNLIITRTFSKAYGLAGLRVGYSVSSAEMADLLNRVRQPFNNNMLALVAAETALADSEYLGRAIAANNAGMQQLTEAFRTLGLAWIPSAGNFVSVDLRREGEPIYQALLRKGVIVRPVANYEMPKHLRVSIGTEKENQLFIKALSEILNDV